MKKSIDKKVKRFAVLLLMLLSGFTVQAQYATALKITGAPDNTSQTAIEKNGSGLLTELNTAQGEKRQLSLKNIAINKEAAASLYTMWEICPFRCDELEISERCLNTASGGFQVRNIPVIMEPRSGEKFEEDKYQEIVLNYTPDGEISSICFAISSSMYKQIMKSDREVTDLRRRAMVIDFVEQFRTAYNLKDIQFLEDIYSDDALIITGKVIQRRAGDGIKLKPEVKYSVQKKREYLDKLKKVFQNSPRLNVVFEEVKVKKHGIRENIYGVKLVQFWNSGSYSDKGYLFLLWDFEDEAHPKIHVRTWQPYEDTPPDSAFQLADFKIN